MQTAVGDRTAEKQRDDVYRSLFASRSSHEPETTRRTNSCKHLCVFSLQKKTGEAAEEHESCDYRADESSAVSDVCRTGWLKIKGKFDLFLCEHVKLNGSTSAFFFYLCFLFLSFLHKSFISTNKSEVFAHLLSFLVIYLLFDSYNILNRHFSLVHIALNVH